MFNRNTYIDRRNRLRNNFTSGLLLFLGNEESPMNFKDNPYHFRQDSSFLYFFGLDFPGLAGVIDLDSGDDIIFGDDYTVEDIVWVGHQPPLKEKAKLSGVSKIAATSGLSEYLEKAVLQNRTIHFLPPYRPENKIKLFEMLGIHPKDLGKTASLELIQAVVKQRNIKSQEEIEELERAVDLSVDMHISAMKMIRPGINETEVAAEVQRVAKAGGCNLSFPIIATVRGEILHNHHHDNTLKSGDLFLLDAGAESKLHYAGDISSTIPVDPTFTDRQKEIYEVALNSHLKAVSLLKPGVANIDIHLTACRTMVTGLKELGLMKGDVDEAVSQGAHALFFPCGLGHMVGLDVHDMEDLGEVYVGYDGKPKSTQFGLKSLRLGKKLEANNVITIEPGIYFIPALIESWRNEKKYLEFLNYDVIETYMGFGGIRNEEDYLITETGTRVLGKNKPKTIDEVEEIRETSLELFRG